MPLKNETVYEPVPSLTFNTNPPTPFDYLQGRLYWDATDQTLALSQVGGTSPVTIQIGQETQALVWNNTGADFPNGAVVHPNGSVAYRPSAVLSQANVLSTARARGMTTMPIPKNTSGFVTTFGMIRQFDTQTPGWAEGDTLYLSPTVAGGLQNTPPTSGYNVVCGYVLRRHPTDGIIFFSPYPLPAFGDIAGGNYTQWRYDGGMTAAGDARRWVDFNFAAVSLGTGASAPDPVQVNGGTIYTRAFDGNVTLEQLFGCLELNHNWAEGTIVKPHVHWMPTTTNAGNVKWRLTWAISQDAALSGENTVTAVSAAGGTAWVEKRADFTDINLAGYKIGAQFMYRLWRDPANVDGEDTYPDDAAVQTFGLHVLVDTLGSSAVGTK